MSKQIIANRYAQALFMLGKEKSIETLDMYSKSLVDIEHILTEHPLLSKIFYAPIITQHEKQNILIQIFKVTKIDENIKIFLLLLAEKNRLSLIATISSCFKALLNKAKNITEGQLTTAIDIDEKKQSEITQSIEKQINKKLRLAFKTNPDILGGIVLQIDDKVLDVSIRKQLTLLKDTIKRDK